MSRVGFVVELLRFNPHSGARDRRKRTHHDRRLIADVRMTNYQRNIVVGVGMSIALLFWEVAVFRRWVGSARLIPSQVTPLDSRHNNVWFDEEQHVVSYLTRDINPKTGEEIDPYFSGPVLLRNPRTGETEVLVGADVQNLKNHTQVVQRYLLPHYRETTTLIVRRYYLSEVVSPTPLQLPAWIPLEFRRWIKLNMLGIRSDKKQLTLFDGATELPIGTVSGTDWRRQEVFAADGSGFVLIFADRSEWFNLPPQIAHDSVWMQAVLPPAIALGLIAVLRWRAIRRNRALLKQPEGWTPTG
jgi:hypothetical protein